jgi:hypothetical protein
MYRTKGYPIDPALRRAYAPRRRPRLAALRRSLSNAYKSLTHP